MESVIWSLAVITHVNSTTELSGRMEREITGSGTCIDSYRISKIYYVCVCVCVCVCVDLQIFTYHCKRTSFGMTKRITRIAFNTEHSTNVSSSCLTYFLKSKNTCSNPQTHFYGDCTSILLLCILTSRDNLIFFLVLVFTIVSPRLIIPWYIRMYVS